MSHARALREIERFLSTSGPEVLSISGRWGVGKTHAWDAAIKKKARQKPPLDRYAYVSAFGLRSIDALKTAIVQSTVRLDADELEPTVESFFENLKGIEWAKNLAEQGARKWFVLFQRVATAIPYAGKVADLLAPGAALLIRNQIICIDDIERSGQGLDVSDILGLVSSLRERRGCKVVLLLNEEGLGEAKSTFREYLEKVVDQAIRFEPTAEESASAALDPEDPRFTALSGRTIALGITNIRVIRRICRFLSFIEPKLATLHPSVMERVVQSIALLGWCVFEPNLAPQLHRLKHHTRFSNLFSKEERLEKDLTTDTILSAYDFARFEEIDAVILVGLQTGGFDEESLTKELATLDERFKNGDARIAIERPWDIFRYSFEDDVNKFADALVSSIENHAAAMDAGQASDVLGMLRELGREDEARRLAPIYVDGQKARPREFFEWKSHGSFFKIDPMIEDAFDRRLAEIPMERDLAETLLRIGQSNGWRPEDTAFLASVPVDDYYALLKRVRGRDLHLVIGAALQFGRLDSPHEQQYKIIVRSMEEALRRVRAEGRLNAMRVKPYLGGE